MTNTAFAVGEAEADTTGMIDLDGESVGDGDADSANSGINAAPEMDSTGDTTDHRNDTSVEEQYWINRMDRGAVGCKGRSSDNRHMAQRRQRQRTRDQLRR